MSKQYGEKGHMEYHWSIDIRERILQFYFQLTRTNNESTLQKLENHLKQILTSLICSLKMSNDDNEYSKRNVILAYLSYLYCLIGQTRDIIDGKGEYTLTYMMIFVWYDYFPDLSINALKTLVKLENGEQSYGSWKDIKYFYKYCKDKDVKDAHPLINAIVKITNEQVREDYHHLIRENYQDISLACKWIPREKNNKWQNLYTLLACDYFNEYIETGYNYDKLICEKKDKYSREVIARIKCKTKYRQLISSINKVLDTTQIKQCAKEWSEIDFQKVTSITLNKNKKAFLNRNKNGEIRFIEDDRTVSSEHFIKFIKDSLDNNQEIKGKRLGMNDFTKAALKLIEERKNAIYSNTNPTLQSEIDLLNMQWKNHSNQLEPLKKMIALIDLSESMIGDPMNAAIALGIRIAEKSFIGNRLMTFSNDSTWLNLDTKDYFIDKVEYISETIEYGLNAEFYKALDKILDAIVEMKLELNEIKDMILVILSDMQMDPDDYRKDSLYQNIVEKYKEIGIRLFNKPIKPPHILFWNLRSTDGFPNVYNESNTSMASGYSSQLLNDFCNNGHTSFFSLTPWSLFVKNMEKKRYQILKKIFSENWTIDFRKIDSSTLGITQKHLIK